MLTHWATEIMTVWPIGATDEYGLPSYGQPYTVKGAYKSGGKTRRDMGGNEFVPRSTFMLINEVTRSQYIAVGDHSSSASPVDGAERIRDVGKYSPQAFAGRAKPVYEAFTE
jgi:hypothetical protein